MNDLSNIPHHVVVEEISQVLADQVRNEDLSFFRILVAQALCVIASTMRARVVTEHRGEIPVNGYSIALSPSGTGKGASMALIDEVTKDFRRTFIDHTMPLLADTNLWKLAMSRAARNGTEEQVEYDALAREYKDAGAFAYSFDEATKAAIRQARHKLLLANCGALNLVVDEVGTNLTSVMEALASYLELYDQGFLKRSLTKNTAENKRTEEIEGKTPANALLFGTPTKLLDGTKTEDDFYSLLETGYARRCFFAMGKPALPSRLTHEEQYDKLCDPSAKAKLQKWATHFATLADPTKIEWMIDVPRDVGIALVAYQMECEELARNISDHEPIRKAEMAHRYYKAIKLAGAFAFIEEEMVMNLSHLNSAIKLVEESGEAFSAILKRERAYAKLARYLAQAGTELTHADLNEVLPFYKSGGQARNEMMTMATAWGYKNHIIIKKRFVDNVELFMGEALKETSLDAVSLAWSDDFAYGYQHETAEFKDLHVLTQAPGMHWINHAVQKGHRAEENVIPGFNLVVLDIDGDTTLDTVHELMKDFIFMTYTTKRHDPDNHRFRLILPTNYELKLDQADYKIFMRNVMDWLPFKTDESADQRSKKWMSNSLGTYHYNLEGRLLDVLPFVPQTSRNDEYRKEISQLGSLDNLERWFAGRISEGNRNNHMIKFALALVDSGMPYPEVEEKVLAFNKKLSNGLPVEELRSTVFVTVARKIQKQA